MKLSTRLALNYMQDHHMDFIKKTGGKLHPNITNEWAWAYEAGFKKALEISDEKIRKMMSNNWQDDYIQACIEVRDEHAEILNQEVE